MEILKGILDGFSYFSLIFSYFIFLPESSDEEGSSGSASEPSSGLY